MKNIHIIMVSLLLMLSSCKLDRQPYDSLTNDQVENTEGSVQALNLGNYHTLKSWVENWHRITEYPGDNVSISGTTTDNFFYNYNYQRLVTNDRVNSYWSLSYKIISGTNNVLTKVKEGASEEDNQIIAESLYLRSLMYFYLTNVFGRPYSQNPETNLAVPIKLSNDPFEVSPRKTVKELYDQLLNDLIKAESLFTKDKSKLYATKESTQALLARVYLYMGNNNKAIEYADKVINSGKFSLIPTDNFHNFAVMEPSSNPESIFAIKFVKDIDYESNGWYTIGSMYANVNGSGWGEMYASRTYLEEVRKYPEDVRYKLIKPVVVNENELHAYYVDDNYKYGSVIVTKNADDYLYQEGGVSKTLIKESNGAGSYQYYINILGKRRSVLIDKKLDNRNGYLKYYILKCSGQEGQAHLWSPVVSRLAEMYLIRAEANAKLNKTQLALDDVNIIRKRAGIPTPGLWTTDNMNGLSALQIVVAERKLEFAFEGHRKFDVFRNNLELDRRYPGTHIANENSFKIINSSDNAIIEYIPEQQITLTNGILTQNP